RGFLDLKYNSVSTELEYNDIKSVRKAMYIQRRKNFPPYPSSLDDAITQLNELQNEDFLMFRGGKCIHLPDDYTFICLTTEENLQCLTSCRYIYGRSIRLCSKIILFNYTSFMAIKTQSLLFKIEILHIDFEIGAIQATKEVFLDVKIKTCRFHIGQAWWCKIINFQINGNTKLRMAYYDQKNDLHLWLKSFFGLSFIAPDDVEDAFVELISTCPNITDGQLFSDYVLETYVEPGCLQPPTLWAETPSLNPRYTMCPGAK
ncbi:hypothetical protein AGLY_018188, partial [Aphis glycines]